MAQVILRPHARCFQNLLVFAAIVLEDETCLGLCRWAALREKDRNHGVWDLPDATEEKWPNFWAPYAKTLIFPTSVQFELTLPPLVVTRAKVASRRVWKLWRRQTPPKTIGDTVCLLVSV